MQRLTQDDLNQFQGSPLVINSHGLISNFEAVTHIKIMDNLNAIKLDSDNGNIFLTDLDLITLAEIQSQQMLILLIEDDNEALPALLIGALT